MFRRTAAAAVLSAAALADAQGSFAIVALPDTQNYVNSSANAPLFTRQTQWIRDEVLARGNPRNIVFVSHLGDLVSSGSSITQWNRADTSMGVLDAGGGVVAYSVTPGNHDFASTGNKGTGTDNYVAYFGPQRFAGRSWFGGADPSGNNSFQLFDGGGTTYLHISLEWRPADNTTNGPTRSPSPIEWAQQVIRDHPRIPTIISTHEHVDDDPAGRSPAGEALWNQLIRRNDQVILVMNGHFHSLSGFNDGEYHQASTNDYGNPVFEVLSDYQDYPRGGDGWLRIVTFDPAADAIRFETYSPVLDAFQTETVAQVGPFASLFTLPLDFDTRYDFVDPPEPPRELFTETIIRQGLGGYAGTSDKEIRAAGGDATNGDNTSISVDASDGGGPTDAMIRFDDLFGHEHIPAGTAIEQASLRLTVVNPGSGFDAYAMAAAWDESTTWLDFGGDGITPGIEAAATPLARIGANTSGENVPTGTLAIDITALVREWAAGAPNLGIGLASLPAGTNGVDFSTSESASPPELVVRSLLPGLRRVTFTPGQAGYAGANDTQLRQSAPNADESRSTSFSVDASDGGGQNHVLIRFDDLFGTGPDRIPAGSRIARATLTVTADNPGDGAAVHRLLRPFRDTDTWAGSFGGNGVQADGLEAVATADTLVAGGTGAVDIDVTASLRAWSADPASNLGWVLLPAGSNGWDFASADAAPASRPVLGVIIDTFCPADINGDGAADVFDILAYFDRFGAGDPDADLDANGIVNIFDILAYFERFAEGC